jgi:3-phenylpropionate/cinnamic acid dioxygenase small subunit
MDDICIYSNDLLDAIHDFYKKNKEICDKTSYNSWKLFDDKAFNYRPWQCC